MERHWNPVQNMHHHHDRESYNLNQYFPGKNNLTNVELFYLQEAARSNCVNERNIVGTVLRLCQIIDQRDRISKTAIAPSPIVPDKRPTPVVEIAPTDVETQAMNRLVAKISSDVKQDQFLAKQYLRRVQQYTGLIAANEEFTLVESIGLNRLAAEAYATAAEKGWWDDPREDGTLIALMHSELSEVLEELRKGHKPDEIYYSGDKPEGVPIEFMDVFIRILDFAGYHGLDLDSAYVIKRDYNKKRPFKHGGKQF